MKFLPWKEDLWLSRNGNVLVYDKLEHFLIAAALMMLGVVFFPTAEQWHVALAVLALGVFKEVYDGVIPYDGEHIEGFSMKDVLADLAGIAVGWFLVWASG